MPLVIDDHMRRIWVLNDHSLYIRWRKSTEYDELDGPYKWIETHREEIDAVIRGRLGDE